MNKLKLGFVYVILLFATCVTSPLYSTTLLYPFGLPGLEPHPEHERVIPVPSGPRIPESLTRVCVEFNFPCVDPIAPSPPRVRPSTGLSYVVDATGLINVTIDRSKIPSDIMASADAAASNFVNKLRTNQIKYEESVAEQNSRPTPSDFDGLQDEYLLQEDMEAELRWWRYLDWTLKTAGVAGLAAGATALTNQLQQLNAIAPARVVLVITLMSAVAAETASQAVQDKQDELRSRITELKKEIDQERWDRFWQLEGGVPTTDRPWLDFSPCIYKNFCNYSQVCVTNGASGAKECGERTIACEERLVSCPN